MEKRVRTRRMNAFDMAAVFRSFGDMFSEDASENDPNDTTASIIEDGNTQLMHFDNEAFEISIDVKVKEGGL